MLTNSDITKLKHIFVTKDEFQDHFDVLEGKFNQVINIRIGDHIVDFFKDVG